MYPGRQAFALNAWIAALSVGTILFANELGLGLGHVNRLASVAVHLPAHRLLFAVPDERLARSAIEARLGDGIEIASVAEWRWEPAGRLSPGEASATLADVLFDFGFSALETVAPAVRRWQARIDRLKPDLIVADFAPMLRIATAGRIPTLMLGNGYTVPPYRSPLPGIRPDNGHAAPALSAEREGEVLATANRARRVWGHPDLACAADLFRADTTFPSTLPLFDPYEAIRAEPLVQPFNIPTMSIGPDFSQREGPDVFCYLDAAHPAINPVLTALNRLERRSQVYVRNLDPYELAHHCAPQVGIHQAQADFSTVLPQTRLVIHGAGPGTCVAALLAGVPQLLLPRFLEQELTMLRMDALGCSVGAVLDGATDPDILRELISRLLERRDAQVAALAAARSLQATLTRRPEAVVVEACEKLLGV